MENAREPEPLVDYNEKKHLNAVKDGDLQKYENEYHLMKDTLSLPQKYMELSGLEQRMVLFFIDKDFVEPNSEKHTENNAFISFIASYENQSVIRKIYHTAFKVIGYDKEGNPIRDTYKEVDPDKRDIYLKLVTQSAGIWKNSNLKEISKSMKEIVTNNGFRDDEMLEHKILADALSSDRSAYTMANRRLAVEIKGMKKPMGLQQINVYLEGGGKKASEIISETAGNPNYIILPKDENIKESGGNPNE